MLTLQLVQHHLHRAGTIADPKQFLFDFMLAVRARRKAGNCPIQRMTVLPHHQPIVVFFQIDGLTLRQRPFAEERKRYDGRLLLTDDNLHFAALAADARDYVHDGISCFSAHCSTSRLTSPSRPVRASLAPPLRNTTARPVSSSMNAPSTQPYANP